MSVNELLLYKGTNPCPEDFDQFWDNGLQALTCIKEDISIEPSGFSMPYVDGYNLWFTGVGGARIYAKYLRRKGAPISDKALLYFHGYRRSSPSWSMLSQYVCAGFDVFALDCRGQGGLSEDAGKITGTTFSGHIIRGVDDPDTNKLLMSQIMSDCAQLARIARDMGSTKIYTFGASQGGGLSLACAALSPFVTKTVAMMPFLCDYKHAWEVCTSDSPYVEIRDYFMFHDPCHEREDEIFTKLGYIDVQYLARRIQSQVLMLTGLKDSACPPSTQYAAYNKITSPKKIINYPDYGHEVCIDMEDRALQFILD